MLIHVKQACEFKSPAGLVYKCAKDFIGTPPEWVEKDLFFQRMAAAGLITMHIDSTAVDKQLAVEEKTEKASKKK